MAVKWFRIWWRANGLATKIDRIFLLTWTCFLLFSNASDASISGFPIFACISVHMPHDLTKPKTVLTWNFIDLCEFHLLPYWRTLDINKNNNIENLTLMAVLWCYMTMAPPPSPPLAPILIVLTDELGFNTCYWISSRFYTWQRPKRISQSSLKKSEFSRQLDGTRNNTVPNGGHFSKYIGNNSLHYVSSLLIVSSLSGNRKSQSLLATMGIVLRKI